MDRSYQVASVKDRARIAEFLSKEGQVLLPLVDLVEETRLAVDELVEVVGRATRREALRNQEARGATRSGLRSSLVVRTMGHEARGSGGGEPPSQARKRACEAVEKAA